MSQDLVISRARVSIPASPDVVLPRLIAAAGETAVRRFLEFFAATIPNRNTRAAYGRAVFQFFAWCDQHQLGELADIEPLHIAAYVESLGQTMAKPTVKQHLAAIRMLFDWLVIGHIVAINPATSVRGPKHVVRRGKTPVLDREEARALLDSIPAVRSARQLDGAICEVPDLVGLRDRALIATMIYTFGRVSAVLGMRVEDYYPLGKRWRVRLHEKGGKLHDVPAHHKLEAYLDAYIKAAGLVDDKKSPLFRSAVRRTGALTETALDRRNAWDMIQRRTAGAGVLTHAGCHTFRGTGITIHRRNGGKLEDAQRMAAHASPRTTMLYDHSDDDIRKSSGSGFEAPHAKKIGMRFATHTLKEAGVPQ
jgi:site-specific recombinase XerD